MVIVNCVADQDLVHQGDVGLVVEVILQGKVCDKVVQLVSKKRVFW